MKYNYNRTPHHNKPYQYSMRNNNKTAQPHKKIASLKDFFYMFRPAQWTKNLFLFAAFFFALFDKTQVNEPLNWLPFVLLAFLVFCLCSSATYVFNDLHDRENDKKHREKQNRPIASGKISSIIATSAAIMLLFISAVLCCFLPIEFSISIAVYLIIQLSYTLFLKKIKMLDVFVLASGFVIRAVSGAFAIDVRISPYLLLCVFLLALFLGFCKRKADKTLQIPETAFEPKNQITGIRPIATRRAAVVSTAQTASPQSTQGLILSVIDLKIIITAASLIFCYALYTLATETIQRFHTENLILTLPIVIFGVFRYLQCVYEENKGSRPEQILLRDRTLQCTICCWLLACAAIFMTTGISFK